MLLLEAAPQPCSLLGIELAKHALHACEDGTVELPGAVRTRVDEEQLGEPRGPSRTASSIALSSRSCGSVPPITSALRSRPYARTAPAASLSSSARATRASSE